MSKRRCRKDIFRLRVVIMFNTYSYSIVCRALNKIVDLLLGKASDKRT